MQDAIRSATDSQAKARIAMEAGDQLPVIAEMYEHYVAAPARRMPRRLSRTMFFSSTHPCAAAALIMEYSALTE